MDMRFSALLAALALMVASLACALGEPSLSNIRTAKDQDGRQVSSIFAPGDTVYVVCDLKNGAKGNVVSSKWYVDKVDGYDSGSLIDEADITLQEDQLSYNVYFYFPPPNGNWPVGSYRVELYFNKSLNSTVSFTIQ